MNRLFEDMKMQAVPDAETVAGLIEMLPERRKRVRKRYAGIVIAASAAVLCSISAAAVINYYHRESVERYFADDSQDTDIPAKAASAENDRFRITLDRTFCDGENVTMIFTVEPLDGEPFYKLFESPDASYEMPKYSVNPELSPDGSFELNAGLHGSGCHASYTDEDRANNIFRFVFWYSARQSQRDILGETHLRFSEFMYIAEPENPFRDIFIQTDVEKNTDSVTLYAEDGTEAVMSQVGFYIYNLDTEKFNAQRPAEGLPEMYFITADGTREKANDTNRFSAGTEGLQYLFDSVINLDDYAGFELMGVKYLKN